MRNILFLLIGTALAAAYYVYSRDIFLFFYGTEMTLPIRLSLVPQLAILPLYFSIAIPKMLSSDHDSFDQFFVPVFILGVGLSALVLVAFAIDLSNRTEPLDQWIKRLLGSGKLAFYLSTIMFGAYATSIGWSMDSKKRGVIAQVFFYAFCFIVLVYIFEIRDIKEEPLSIALTSWMLLFSIGTWEEVEHYITEFDVPMATQHFASMAIFNVLTSIGVIYIVFNFTAWPIYAKLASISIFALALLCSGHLYARYVSPYAKG